MTFDYKIVSNLVKGSDGTTTVYTAASVTAAIQWAIAHANTITYCPAGTYTLTADLTFASGTSLYGDGDTTIFTATALRKFYLNGVSNIYWHHFRITGHCYVYGTHTNGTCTNWDFAYITTTYITGDVLAAWYLDAKHNGIIDGITFDHCVSSYNKAYGFLFYGSGYADGNIFKHVDFTDCDASHNGNDDVPWINAWITGYDLCELCQVQDMTLTRCTANYNWCSGFHIEYGAAPLRCALIDCVGNYNGQKPNIEMYYGYGYKLQTFQVGWPGRTVNGGGTGVYGGGVALVRCSGIGNPQGMTPIDTRTSWDMKIWLGGTNLASTGNWYPAGAPTSASDIILSRNGSTTQVTIDTYYHTIWAYYSGSYTIGTPTAPPTGEYDYMIVGVLVKNYAGSTVYTGATFTAALNWALAHANTITYVPASSNTIAADVVFAAGTSLYGDGDETNFTSAALYKFSVSNVSTISIHDLRFSGLLYVNLSCTSGTIGTFSLMDVHAENITSAVLGAFICYTGTSSTIDGVTMARCTVNGSACHGFLLTGNGSANSNKVKNVAMTDCEANGCGALTRYNAYITGYDLCEGTNVENLTITTCKADGNWESGFHFDNAGTKVGVSFVNCDAPNNGVNPAAALGYGYYVGTDAYIGNGIDFTNCTGAANANGLTPFAPDVPALTLNVWTAAADGNASTAGNWSKGHAPTGIESPTFQTARSNKICTWDIAGSFGAFVLSGATGTMNWGAVAVSYYNFYQNGWTNTPNVNGPQTPLGDWNYVSGTLTSSVLKLIVTGVGSTITTPATLFYSLTLNASCTLASRATYISVQVTFTVAAGVIPSIANGSVLYFQAYTGTTWTNAGELAGVGTGYVRFLLYNSDQNIAFGNISCPVLIEGHASMAASRTCNIAVDTAFGSSFTINSLHASNTVTLNFAGTDLSMAGLVTVSTRALLGSSAAGGTINAPAGITGAGTIDLTNVVSVTTPSCTVTTIGGSNTTDFVVPAGTTSLIASAFAGCAAMKSVTIPSGLTTIGASAFSGCTQLTSLSFYGLVAPTSAGANWILNVPAGARGHAYTASNFPTPTNVWNGLTMGDTLDPSNVPAASFTADLAIVECMYQTQFTDTSANNPTSWLWDFGDGRTSTLQNPCHQWNQPGLFTVRLTATNNIGSNTYYLPVSVTRPELGLQCIIGGRMLISYRMLVGSMNIREAVGVRASASMTIHNSLLDGTFTRPVVGERVYLQNYRAYINGVPSIDDALFSGSIVKIVEKETDNLCNEILYDVEAVSDESSCDRHLVINYAPTAAIPAGEYVWYLRSVLENHGHHFFASIEDGPDILTSFNYMTVAECMDKICQLTGYSWYISATHYLHFYDTVSATSPVNITEEEGNYSGLQVETCLDDYENCLWVEGDALSTPITETFRGDGSKVQFMLPNPCHLVPTVRVGGVAQTVGIYQLDTGKQWYWSQGSNAITQGVGTVLTSAQVLQVVYQFIAPFIRYGKLSAEVAARAAVQGDDGRYERFKKVQNTRTTDEIDAFIAADLAKYGRVSKIIKFQSDNPLIHAGLVMTAEIPGHDVSGTYLVTSVDVQDIDGTILRRTVTAQSGAYMTTWTDYFKDLNKK